MSTYLTGSSSSLGHEEEGFFHQINASLYRRQSLYRNLLNWATDCSYIIHIWDKDPSDNVLPLSLEKWTGGKRFCLTLKTWLIQTFVLGTTIRPIIWKGTKNWSVTLSEISGAQRRLYSDMKRFFCGEIYASKCHTLIDETS